MSTQPPQNLVPPFTRETAAAKVRKAEDGWNTRDPQKVVLAYTVDSKWRNRAEFVNGREEIIQFLTRKWRRELDWDLLVPRIRAQVYQPLHEMHSEQYAGGA